MVKIYILKSKPPSKNLLSPGLQIQAIHHYSKKHRIKKLGYLFQNDRAVRDNNRYCKHQPALNNLIFQYFVVPLFSFLSGNCSQSRFCNRSDAQTYAGKEEFLL